MNQPPRNPAGGVIAACEDEAGCKPLRCAECLQEIPADAAHAADIEDYVHHFCGLDCLSIWQKKRPQPPAPVG